MKQNADTFIGLIGEDGVGRSSYMDECSMTFTLCAYVKNNGALQEDEVVVHRTIPDLEFSIEGLEPLTIVELTGDQIIYHGQNRINLSIVQKTGADHPELQDFLRRRLEPVVYASKDFGNFILDRRTNWFETKATWSGHEINLFLSGALSDMEQLVDQAKRLFDRQSDWDAKFRDRITDDLLSLKNENWTEEDEKLLSEQEFRERLKVDSIVIYVGDDFEAWFDDGNLFLGHSISVQGDLGGQLHKANLQG